MTRGRVRVHSPVPGSPELMPVPGWWPHGLGTTPSREHSWEETPKGADAQLIAALLHRDSAFWQDDISRNRLWRMLQTDILREGTRWEVLHTQPMGSGVVNAPTLQYVHVFYDGELLFTVERSQ